MHRSVLVEQAHEKALATARHGASTQGEIIVTTRAILTSLATIPETMSGSGRACHEPFRLIVANTPWLENLWLTSPNGKVLCSSLPADTVFSGGSLAYVSEALKTEMFATSELVTSPVAGKPTILTVMPRFGPEGVESALVASMDLNWLNRLARQTSNEAHASVFVLDRANTIVAAYPDAGQWVGHKIKERAIFDEPTFGQEGLIEATGPNGEGVLFAYSRIPETEEVLAVSFDRRNLLEPSNRVTLLALGKLMLIGLVLITLVGLCLERLIVKPLNSLTRTMKRLGEGDLEARAPTDASAPEFRILASNLNAMAAELAVRAARMDEANDRLAAEAATDFLTGIANRRKFDVHLAEEWRRAMRDGTSVALLMIDVDHFKRFNDRYGHPAGDDCLRSIAAVLSAHARRSGDLAGRVGGEEFALLLPGAVLEEALRVAGDLRTAIEVLAVWHEDGIGGRLTASIGVAAMRPNAGQEPRALMRSADQFLYEAKAAGRNRIIHHRPHLSLAS